MPLFRSKNNPANAADGVTRFWLWWGDARPRIEKAIEDRTLASLANDLTAAVKAIHPDLVWELGPSERARNMFCVSCEGNLAIRRYAEQWLAAAPTSDGVWEFVTARPPVPADSLSGLTIDLGGTPATVGEGRVKITPNLARERLDISVWHPAFPGVSAEVRARLGYLMLDSALGEDGVERWIGRIEWAAGPPDEPVAIAALPDEVARFSTALTGDKFALFQGPSAGTGKPLILSANTALKHIDNIGKEFLLTVTIPCRSKTPNGLPDAEDAARLNQIEDELDLALKDAAVVGRLTGNGLRVLYRYTASDAAAGIAKTWATKFLGDRRVSIDVREDAGWDWYRDGIYRAFKPSN